MRGTQATRPRWSRCRPRRPARGAALSVHSASPPALATLTREITPAAGRFAAGPDPLPPFELVDAVLEETRAVQRRLRDLLSRARVDFLLAMCLFPEVGYWCGPR
ncbi:transposase domain-containing protein [Amycolatopsis sp. cmx-4-61]|uniref:transposase domain-containing protein n=1 Tax=Amycolatopsis sp. cmx-4-61 TaxID=2790937 RepID=UPI00397A7C6D